MSKRNFCVINENLNMNMNHLLKNLLDTFPPNHSPKLLFAVTELINNKTLTVQSEFPHKIALEGNILWTTGISWLSLASDLDRI